VTALQCHSPTRILLHQGRIRAGTSARIDAGAEYTGISGNWVNSENTAPLTTRRASDILGAQVKVKCPPWRAALGLIFDAESAEMSLPSEKSLSALLDERRTFPPSEEFKKSANVVLTVSQTAPRGRNTKSGTISVSVQVIHEV